MPSQPPRPGRSNQPAGVSPRTPLPSGLMPTDEVVLPRRAASPPETAIAWPSWDVLQERMRDAVERSPPLSTSIAVHLVVILLLAIWWIQGPPRQDRVIEIAFSDFTEKIAEEKGVEIAPTPEPPEEPQPEEVESEKPLVEDPVAAPPQAVEEVVEVVGPAAAAVAAAAPIGTLLDGREEGRREVLVKAYGGSDATEAAVARALAWIVRQQDRKTGLWSLQGPYADGSSQENKVAATAMALLALQGAGNTPRAGKHRAAVTRGWKAMLGAQLEDGRFEIGSMPARQGLYSHGQAMVALCELAGMTQEKQYFEPARRAVAYAVAAQGPTGGWRYEPGKDGDMSVTGWFMMALKSAEMAYVPVPLANFERLGQFLDRVAVENGARYGYRSENPENPAMPVTDAVSAEGLLCRQYLGWKRDDPRLVAGAEMLLANAPIDFREQPNAYAWYYITQVVHNLGGSAWERWNAVMREAVPEAQEKKGPDAGSWDPSRDRWGSFGGRLYMTCFCTYMLEVYYRHLPLYEAVKFDDAGGP